MKQRLIPLFLCLCLGLTACGPGQSQPAGGEVELVVFAAASMTETLQEVAGLYAQTAPQVKLTFNFDSSGTLKTQIEEGAVCDLFLSAGQKQMDQLDAAGGLDLLLPGSRVDLLENRVTLCVPEGNPAGLGSFEDMAWALSDRSILLAMGNSDVPVGQYTQKILSHFGLDEEALANSGVITYGANVKEVTTQIIQGSVDCGVIYCTDAHSAGLTPVAYATPELCGRVVYPAALLRAGEHQAEAQAFLDYLSTPEAMAVFEAVGFSAA